MKLRDVDNIDEIIIHCSDSTFGSASVIDEWHKERGWDEIGYNFVICNGDGGRDGEIQKGRNIKYVPAHCKGHNSNSIGICLIGKNTFTLKQFMALRDLLDELCDVYDIRNITGHYEYSTKTCPNFNVEDFLEIF